MRRPAPTYPQKRLQLATSIQWGLIISVRFNSNGLHMDRLSAASVLLFLSVTLPAAPPDTQPATPAAQRWTLLPHNVRSIYVDRKGRTWFEDSTAMLPQEDFRRLTASAFAGIINTVSARVLLVDSRGTLWMMPHNSEDLVAFDGKNWTVQHPSPRLPTGKQSGAFGQPGWEDASGNIFFPDNLGIFWRSPDGKWGYQPLYERNEREKRFYATNKGTDGQYHVSTHGPQTSQFYGRCAHLLGPDGSVYVWAQSATLGMFRFDGKTWTHYDSTNGFPYENLRSLLVMPDGSIGILQPEDDVLHFLRIPGATGDPPGLARLIARLDDADATQRDSATETIFALGPTVVPFLQRELKSTDVPEVQSRLPNIIARLQRIPPNRYCGRFDCRVLAAVPLLNGNVLLWVTQLKDTTTKQEYGEAKILISPEQPWRVIPAPPHPPNDHPGFHEDMSGRLWIGRSRSELATFGIAEPKQIISTDMAGYHPIAGPDARGRMYFTNSMQQLAILDEAAPEHAGPALAMDRWPADTWAVASQDGTVWAWLLENNGPATRRNDAGKLRRFHDGKWDAPPDTPTGVKLSSMIPLKQGGVLVVIEGYAQSNLRRFAAYFDGQQWHQADDLRDLIAGHADSLRALYDGDGQASDRFERMKIDDAGNFWVTQWERFARYDGKQWLDLTEVIHKAGPKGLKFRQPSDVRLFNGSKSIFVQDFGQSHTSWFLAQGGKGDKNATDVTVVKSMPNPLVSGIPFGYSLVDRQGNLWGQATRAGKDELVMFSSADAAPTYVTPGGHPIFCDREGRVWTVATRSGILRVRQGEALSSVTIDGASFASRMAQTPDGRLFLFHAKGLSEVKLSSEGGLMLLSEVNHWQDGFPIGKDGLCFFSDTHGALWLLTYPELLRFTPPK